MSIKVTFTLDEATIERLTDTARRLAKPKSEVVREAIRDFHARSDRLSEAERQRLLRKLDEMMSRPATRTQREVNQELAEIRRARRQGGRLHRAKETA
jgi:predicted transcriptional regulator